MAKPFRYLYCSHDQRLTPHFVERVSSENVEVLEMEMRCGECGARSTYVTDELPEGWRVYRVRIEGDAGVSPHTGEPLVGFQEEFTTVGSSRQDAYERSLVGRRHPAAGHALRTYLDGVEHRDERY